ncbi:MAG: hypothetical protein ACRD0U_18035, partial [Acidimicrobiales bacterium]
SGGPEAVLRLERDGNVTASDVALAPGRTVFVATRPFGQPYGAGSRAPFVDEPAGSVDVQVWRAQMPPTDVAPEVIAGRGRGCTITPTPVAEAQFSDLRGIAEHDGIVYVADPVCGEVYAIGDGMVHPLLLGDRHQPTDVAVVGRWLYLTDLRDAALLRVALTGGEPEPVLVGDPEGAPQPGGDEVNDVVDHDDVRLTEPWSVSVADDSRLLVCDGKRLLLVGID